MSHSLIVTGLQSLKQITNMSTMLLVKVALQQLISNEQKVCVFYDSFTDNETIIKYIEPKRTCKRFERSESI